MRVAWLVMPLCVLALAACKRAEPKADGAAPGSLTIETVEPPTPQVPGARADKMVVLPGGVAAAPEAPAPAQPPRAAAPVHDPGLDYIPGREGPRYDPDYDPREADPDVIDDCREAARIDDPFADSGVCRRILGR